MSTVVTAYNDFFLWENLANEMTTFINSTFSLQIVDFAKKNRTAVQALAMYFSLKHLAINLLCENRFSKYKSFTRTNFGLIWKWDCANLENQPAGFLCVFAYVQKRSAVFDKISNTLYCQVQNFAIPFDNLRLVFKWLNSFFPFLFSKVWSFCFKVLNLTFAGSKSLLPIDSPSPFMS